MSILLTAHAAAPSFYRLGVTKRALRQALDTVGEVFLDEMV
jgi:hypothetical protein